MSEFNITLGELISKLETDMPGASPIEKIAAARLRSANLNDLGEQLVDHFVSKAREADASWSQIGDALGVSKQAAQQRQGQGMYSRFTDKARGVMVLAQDSARKNNGAHLTSEHLLDGVLGVPESVGVQAIEQLADSMDKLRAELVVIMPRDTETPPARMNHSEIARRILDETVQAALELGHNYVGTEHILLGILRVDHCPAAALLIKHGVGYADAKRKVSELLTKIVAANKIIQSKTSEKKK